MVGFDKTRKTWFVAWREKDPITGNYKQRKKRGFQTKREARAFEDNSTGDSSPILFSSLLGLYLASQKGYARENTIEQKKRRIETYCESLMDKRIDRISAKTLLAWKNGLADTEISTTTKNSVIMSVRSLSRFGADSFEYPDFAKALKYFPKNSDDVTEMSILSPEDFSKVIHEVEHPVYKAFFIFLYHTGVRRGEARALLKADIEGNRAKITKSIRRTSQGFTPLKTASSKRTIILDSYVLEAIKPLMNLEGDFVFGQLAPLSTTQIQRKWSEACKKANVKEVRIHDLRHSFVSNAIMHGVNIVVVSKYVGHSTVTQTLNTYSHLLADSEEKMIETLEGVY